MGLKRGRGCDSVLARGNVAFGHDRSEVGSKVGLQSTLPWTSGAMGGVTHGGARSLDDGGRFGRRCSHFRWVGRASGGAGVGAGDQGGGIGGVGLANH
jgi:hypothetical protein